MLPSHACPMTHGLPKAFQQGVLASSIHQLKERHDHHRPTHHHRSGVECHRTIYVNVDLTRLRAAYRAIRPKAALGLVEVAGPTDCAVVRN
jgi:hypothetical protein